MAVTKQKKEEVLQDLLDKFSRSKAVVFADYRGLDVASISEIRAELRKNDSEMKVAKKTLIKLAAKKDFGDLSDEIMQGPVVATFSYEDALSGVQVLFKFSKKNDKLKLLGGIIDGKIVDADVIMKYAKLPSREELLAKLIGSMNAPVSGFVGIGNSLISGIVRVLNAYKDTLPVEQVIPKVEVKEEAPAEEKPVEEKAESESTPEVAEKKED